MSKDYLLADIGGTHARIGHFDGQLISAPVVLKIDDFDDPVALFEEAAKELNLKTFEIAIAAAGQELEKGKIQIPNNPNWSLDKAHFKKAGRPIEFWTNDFFATAYGALTLGHDDLETLIPGEAIPQASKVICGPGTGIGLAYADYIKELKSYRVRETFGGWFPIAAMTQEQALVLRTVRAVKNDPDQKSMGFEDVIAGRGMPDLYRALCRIHGASCADEIVTSILSHPEADLFEETLRLFHEFLGIFLQTVVIAGHGLGGVYLDGGVIQKVCDKGLFDPHAVTSTFHANVHTKHQSTTPIYDAFLRVPAKRIDSPYVALSGLKFIIDNGIEI